jgi:hypothetical protein
MKTLSPGRDRVRCLQGLPSLLPRTQSHNVTWQSVTKFNLKVDKTQLQGSWLSCHFVVNRQRIDSTNERNQVAVKIDVETTVRQNL